MLNLALIAVSTLASPKGAIDYEGMYVEGCSCPPPCPCELTGVAMGCQGVGGFAITRGKFEDQDISGLKFAYAVAPGDWVICYVDAPSEAKYKAGEALCKAGFTAWGKLAPIERAQVGVGIDASGKGWLMVDGGKIMSLKTEPVFGLDKKNAIKFSNINSVLHPVVMQGKVVSCSFNDNGRTFELKGTNAYFNPMITAKGTLAVE